jgi:DNA invertase Pin-like site-specific DNA recombinase
MTTCGYSRVSTARQTVDAQTDALVAAGAERIFTDTMSGIRDDRPGLKAMLDYAREGDVVVVVALDRLGRSLSGVIRTIEELEKRGIVLRSLREQIDFSTATGRLQAAIFSAMAQYERELIRERAAVAREAALARGMRAGRQPVLTVEQLEVARRMRATGETVRTICATFPQASRATIYRLTRDLV